MDIPEKEEIGFIPYDFEKGLKHWKEVKEDLDTKGTESKHFKFTGRFSFTLERAKFYVSNMIDLITYEKDLIQTTQKNKNTK